MSKYTLELRHIYDDSNLELFDFEYELYDNDLKEQFESKFYEHFFFDEIGFPTIAKFKFMLKSKLHMIMPYYKQLYISEIESKEINFLLNKDLKETFIREIDNVSNLVSNVNSSGVNNADNTSFHADTPQSKLVLEIEKYMSSADKDKNSTNYKDSNESNSDTVSKGNEKTELVSQGNIGITSSAELLSKWRDVMINIDEMIFNDLQDLFMQVY